MFTDEEHQVDTTKNKKIKFKDEKKVMSNKNEKKPLFSKPQNMGLFIVICLLVLQILMSGYQTVRDIKQDTIRAQLIASVTQYTTASDQLTTQMLSDYKKDVYNNVNVNSIDKQLVMGTEYNFMAMMLLAKQNSRLLELLSQLK